MPYWVRISLLVPTPASSCIRAASLVVFTEEHQHLVSKAKFATAFTTRQRSSFMLRTGYFSVVIIHETPIFGFPWSRVTAVLANKPSTLSSSDPSPRKALHCMLFQDEVIKIVGDASDAAYSVMSDVTSK